MMKRIARLGVTASLAAAVVGGPMTQADDAIIPIHAGHILPRVSGCLTGACLEDVNDEIYGGLFSQMIVGENFEEPAPAVPPAGFRAFGRNRRVAGTGELWASGADGPKLVREHPPFADGEVGVEVILPDRANGNAGLIVSVDNPGAGADNFDGCEVSLDAAGQFLRLGRPRHNWEHINDTPCEVPVGQWIPLVVRMAGPTRFGWRPEFAVGRGRYVFSAHSFTVLRFE